MDNLIPTAEVIISLAQCTLFAYCNSKTSLFNGFVAGDVSLDNVTATADSANISESAEGTSD